MWGRRIAQGGIHPNREKNDESTQRRRDPPEGRVTGRKGCKTHVEGGGKVSHACSGGYPGEKEGEKRGQNLGHDSYREEKSRTKKKQRRRGKRKGKRKKLILLQGKGGSQDPKEKKKPGNVCNHRRGRGGSRSGKKGKNRDVRSRKRNLFGVVAVFCGCHPWHLGKERKKKTPCQGSVRRGGNPELPSKREKDRVHLQEEKKLGGTSWWEKKTFSWPESRREGKAALQEEKKLSAILREKKNWTVALSRGRERGGRGVLQRGKKKKKKPFAC